MKNLFRFVKVYHFFLIFLIIESLSLILYFSNHNFQRSQFLSFTQECTGYIYDHYNKIHEYLNLKQENLELKKENSKLYSLITLEAGKEDEKIQPKKNHYKYIPARIINNSINNNNNFLTLNKGSSDGVEIGMGIIVENGIIGIIKSVSKNYSKAISILNQRSSVSIFHVKTEHNGTLSWKSNNYMVAEIRDIPNHARIHKGDTIKTNGYSNIYPSGIPIGTISSFKKGNRDGFYNIKVNFINDMNTINNVYIIESLTKREKESL
tara:strand:- start:833 stop:1627 length:795 start_codon:yes stop_codon:yes gene_type:complete